MEGVPYKTKEQNRDPYEKVAREVTDNSYKFDQYAKTLIENPNRRYYVRDKEIRDPDEITRLFDIEESSGEVNGQPLEFLGVWHSPETFLLHRNQIESSVRRAGALVLEAAPGISGIYSHEFREKAQQKFGDRFPAAQIDAWVDEIYGNPDTQFFNEMEQLATKYRKPIIIVDPHSNPETAQETLLYAGEHGPGSSSLIEANIPIANISNVVANTGVIGGSLLLGRYALRQADRSIQKSYQRESDATVLPETKVSRRDLLGGLMGMGVGLTAKGRENAEKDPQNTLLDPVAYDAIDYRDVAVAHAMDEFTRHKTYEGPLVFVSGKDHTKSIKNYLVTPEMRTIRELKYASYAKMRKLKPATLSEYRFLIKQDSTGKDSYFWEKIT